MKQIETLLDYSSSPMPETGVFKISPSAFAKFVERPHTWYREQILKENVFEYNTASVLGTIVHYCAEKVAKNEEVDIDEIEKYIGKWSPNDDYDPNIVKAQYIGMAERLVNDYVIDRQYLEVETQFHALLKNEFYVAGTPDAMEGTKDDCLLCDYKSYSSKTKPKTIPMHYKYQLLVYAWMLRQCGYTVTRIRLIYINRHIEGEISEKTNKRMKSYPPEVTVLTETISEEDIAFIEGLLMLCVDSCLASDDHPELNHVIWHDPRLAP
ncbi:MAG: PD-(D/E)XK nuclease family protein [Dehalococcoidales bacterium]